VAEKERPRDLVNDMRITSTLLDREMPTVAKLLLDAANKLEELQHGDLHDYQAPGYAREESERIIEQELEEYDR
jgi:hypothetical protein